MSEYTDRLPERPPTTRMLAMPTDTNASGDIFGGWIMAQVDIAGAIAAYRRARGRVVTVAAHSFQFHHPVYVGDIVSFYADVAEVGNTSITVNVEVYAERDRQTHGHARECQRVTEATFTYVAIDNNRKPRRIDDR